MVQASPAIGTSESVSAAERNVRFHETAAVPPMAADSLVLNAYAGTHEDYLRERKAQAHDERLSEQSFALRKMARDTVPANLSGFGAARKLRRTKRLLKKIGSHDTLANIVKSTSSGSLARLVSTALDRSSQYDRLALSLLPQVRSTAPSMRALLMRLIAHPTDLLSSTNEISERYRAVYRRLASGSQGGSANPSLNQPTSAVLSVGASRYDRIAG